MTTNQAINHHAARCHLSRLRSTQPQGKTLPHSIYESVKDGLDSYQRLGRALAQNMEGDINDSGVIAQRDTILARLELTRKSLLEEMTRIRPHSDIGGEPPYMDCVQARDYLVQLLKSAMQEGRVALNHRPLVAGGWRDAQDGELPQAWTGATQKGSREVA